MSETLPTIAPDVMDAWKSDVRRRRQELEAEKIRQQANRERIYRESTPSLGESIQLGNRVGLPPDVVDRNAKDIRAREASTILNPRNDPYTQRFLEGALGQVAAQNPESFRKLDDTLADPSHQFIPGAWDFGYVFPDPNTKKIPPWAEVFSKNWEAGWQYVEVGSLGTKYLAGKANEEEILRYLNSEPVEIPDRPGWSDELVGLFIQNVPQILPMVQGAAAGTAIGSFVGLGVGQPVPGAIFGARIGAAVGVFPLHLGNTYLEYHRLASEISVPGPIGPGEVIPDGVVRGTAMAAALIATALDTVGASLIVGRHGRKASQEKMVKLLRSRKLRPLVTELAKRYAKSARDEGLTEFFQELEIAAFGEVLIQVMTEQEGDFFSEDTVYRLLTALAGGAVLGFGFGVVAETAVITAKKKVANALNEQENERLTEQKEAIDESPFSIVDPPVFKTFLQSQFEANGASPEIYIDAKTLVEFFDEKKIDVEQFKMDMPDIFTQLPAALAANADVSISRASYLTYLRDHHETLLPHIRHGVALLTGSEIANTTDELEDEVAASLRALIDEAAAIDPTETTAPSEFDVIEQKMEQKLIDAGQRPSVARFQAKLYRARAERRAPGPLEVVGPDGEPTTPDLEQAAVDREPFVFVGIDEHGSEDADVTPIVADAPSVSALRDLYDDAVIVDPSAERETQLTGQGYQFIDGSDLEQTLLAIDHALYASEGAGGREESRSSEAVYFDADAGHEQAYGIKIRLATHDVVYGDEPMVAVTIGDAQDTDIHLPAGALINPQKVADLAIQMAGRKSLEVAQEENPARHLLPPTTTLEQAQVPEAERPMGGVYYSALGRALRTAKQRKMTVQQLRGLLKKQRVKEDEILWAGLEEYLEGMDPQDKVDLDSLLEQIGLIQVEEVVLGADESMGTEEEWLSSVTARTEELVEAAGLDVDELLTSGDDRYGAFQDQAAGELEHLRPTPTVAAPHQEYTLPGGENNRVTLITLPVEQREDRIADLERRLLSEEGLPEAEYEERNRLRAGVPFEAPPTFTGGHYGDVAPNILVHVRWNERTGPNGEKILFIEEIQDDWAKEGRKKGYASTATDRERAELMDFYDMIEEREKGRAWRLTQEEWEKYHRAKDVLFRSQGVPDRPFKASGASSMLALKRMIAHAAKNGFDSVAWTTGKIQVDRYESALRQSVDEIKWEPGTAAGKPATRIRRDFVQGAWQSVPRSEVVEHIASAIEGSPEYVDSPEGLRGAVDLIMAGGDVRQILRTAMPNAEWSEASTAILDDLGMPPETLQATGVLAVEFVKDGGIVLGMDVDPDTGLVLTSSTGGEEAIGDPIEGVVGKEIAAQILDSEAGSVSGDNLTIGGKGFEDLYDKTLVKGANKLGKQFGTKVERGEIEVVLGRLDSGVTEPHTVHNLPITDKLRASVEEEGLSLFQAAAADKPPRGGLEFDENLENVVLSLTKSHDLSTVLHEFGHLWFLEMLHDIRTGVAGEKLQLDVQAALDYFALDENMARALEIAQAAAEKWAKGESARLETAVAVPEITMKDLEDVLAAGMDYDPLAASVSGFAATGFHEVWAKSFEAYLLEGKAPSVELQSAFDTFMLWLLDIYTRLFKDLGVELNPEIRGVFDRMLATEEQIAVVRSQETMQPVFESAESAGISEAGFAEYLASVVRGGDRYRIEEAKKYLVKVAKLSREVKRAARERIQAQVEADINSQPVHRAEEWLKTGVFLGVDEQPTDIEHRRLNRESLVQLLGEEAEAKIRRLPFGRFGVWTSDPEKGIDPTTVAEMFEFSSPEELVDALIETPSRRERIRSETDRLLAEEYGDLSDRGFIAEEALARMEGEPKGSFLLRELNILAARAGAPGTPQGVARRIARGLIKDRSLRQVRPDIFMRAEQRLMKELLKAVQEEDWETAHRAAMERLVAWATTQEARKIRKENGTTERYLNRLKKKPSQERIGKAGGEFLPQINQLLHRFGFRSEGGGTDRQDLAQWITKMQLPERESTSPDQKGMPQASAFLFDPMDDDLPDEIRFILDEGNTSDWRDLTTGQAEWVRDTIKNIEAQARNELRSLTDAKKRHHEEIVGLLLTDLEENATFYRPKGMEPRISTRFKHGKGPADFAAGHRKFASLLAQFDGKLGGNWWELVLRTMNERGDFEVEEMLKAGDKFEKLLKPLFGFEHSLLAAAHNKISAATFGRADVLRPELLTPRKIKGAPHLDAISQMGRIMAVLNMGNEANWQRLRDGFGLNNSDLHAIKDELSKEEMDFVQGVWNFIHEYWAPIVEKQKRVTGVAPKGVEAVPLETRHGTYPGGYFPIQYEPLLSARSHSDNQADVQSRTMKGAVGHATTWRPHTKERVSKVVGRPIRLDFSVITSHVTDVVHDLAWHEWLIDTTRIFADERIATAISEGYGEPVLEQMRAQMRHIAGGDIAPQKTGDRILTSIRMGSAIAGMGWNMITGSQQVLGLANSADRIGYTWVTRGLTEWGKGLAHQEHTLEWIYSMSSFMETRSKTMNRELAEQQTRITTGTTNAQASFFYLIVKMQQTVDVPTWLGAYHKEMETGSGDQARAAAMADQAVRDSQGSGNIADLAEVQRGTPFHKNWSLFYGYFSSTLQLLAERHAAAKTVDSNLIQSIAKNPILVGRLAATHLTLAIVPAVAQRLMVDLLRDNFDEDETVAKYVAGAVGAFYLNLFLFIREGAGFIEGYHAYDGPAGSRIFSAAGDLARQAAQGEFDRNFLKAAIQFGGIWAKLPAVWFDRLIFGVEALSVGATDNLLAPAVGLGREERREVRRLTQ